RGKADIRGGIFRDHEALFRLRRRTAGRLTRLGLLFQSRLGTGKLVQQIDEAVRKHEPEALLIGLSEEFSCGSQGAVVRTDQHRVVEAGSETFGEVADFVVDARGNGYLTGDRAARSLERNIDMPVASKHGLLDLRFKPAFFGQALYERLQVLV